MIQRAFYFSLLALSGGGVGGLKASERKLKNDEREKDGALVSL